MQDLKSKMAINAEEKVSMTGKVEELQSMVNSKEKENESLKSQIEQHGTDAEKDLQIKTEELIKSKDEFNNRWRSDWELFKMDPELLDALFPQPSGPCSGLLGVSEEAASCVSVRAEGVEVLLEIIVHGGRLVVNLHDGGESSDNIVIVGVLIAVLFH